MPSSPLGSVANGTLMSGRSSTFGRSHGSLPLARNPSLSRITGVRYLRAMRAASMAAKKQPLGVLVAGIESPTHSAGLATDHGTTGVLSLDSLSAMSVPEARAWLESVPGVGPKTSAQVLLVSSLRRKALPVDSHHYRVASRLSLIPPEPHSKGRIDSSKRNCRRNERAASVR